jgi:hypothetical protein
MMHKAIYYIRAMEADNIIKGSWWRLQHFGYHDL